MATPRTISLDEVPASRWVNGGGFTAELAREPRSGPFRWRLSIATISGAATFSHIPGVARALMAITDGPLTLIVDGAHVRLAKYDTVQFTGDQEVASSDPGTAQRDLNLMVRGGTPVLEAVSVSGRIVTPPGLLAAVALEGELRSLARPLSAGDAVLTAGVPTAIRGEGMIAFARVL
jgi:environmental stress-induced protein Ves